MRWYRWGWWHLGFILMFCAKRLAEDVKVENEPYERADNYLEFIVLKALMFTWVNILWLGCDIMVIGTVMVIRRRVRLV